MERRAYVVLMIVWWLALGPGCGVGGAGTGIDGAVDGGADARPDAGPADAGDGGADAAPIVWESCPLYADGSSARLAECAQVDLPLRVSDPQGAQVSIWAQRLLSVAPDRRGQIWWLEGGPGGSGADFDEFLDYFSHLDPRWDLYTLDHRGVGLSDRLGCPDAEDASSESGRSITEAEWPACLQHVADTWGDDLDAYTTTGAAQDLGQLIERTRDPGDEVHVYGVSYGTYWAIRYLQAYPDQATGVILDSIAPPGITFASYDVFFNDMGENFTDLCAVDTLCASKLGADPWASYGLAFDALEQGACPDVSALFAPGTERLYLRYVLGTLLMSVSTRPFIPATVYRLLRCDPGDSAALVNLFQTLFATSAPSVYQLRKSGVLFLHVALAELWSEPAPTHAELLAIADGLYTSIDLGPRVAARQDTWPVYPADSYVGGWPDTQVSILMMNGDLDPQTPPWVAQPAAAHFTAPNQYYYTVPRAAHCVVVNSPVTTPGAHTCGLRMLLYFVDAPGVPPDDACLADTLPVDFAGDPQVATYLFGVTDAWENMPSPVPPSAARSTPPPGFGRALRWLRSQVPPPPGVQSVTLNCHSGCTYSWAPRS